MMSSAESQSTMNSKLEALQCHFTWDLDCSRSKLLRIRDELEDIDTKEGNSWLGHIYNLQGFTHYQLGLIEDTQSFFSRATEAFRRMRNTDVGPWLVVNYGNLAWLHHCQGGIKESQDYLSKIDALMNEYPSPSQDELHAEVYAEKAWTLMKFSKDKKLLAADYFQRAIRMQPDMVEWQTSCVLGLVNAHKHSDTGLSAEILEKMRIAKEQDPENLYLAVHYLEQAAERGEHIEDEACDLARKILKNPVSSYSGMKALLRLYRKHISIDEAIILAEEALKNHPDKRYLKRCAALCYKWKILFFRDSQPKQSMVNRAISLHKEVISLYPSSSLVKKVDLANIYAKTSHCLVKAEQMYQELLEKDLEPGDKQMLYNSYAKYLNFDCQKCEASVNYHMKTVAIPEESFFRENSMKVLVKIRNRGRGQMCRKIGEFLANLQKDDPACRF